MQIARLEHHEVRTQAWWCGRRPANPAHRPLFGFGPSELLAFSVDPQFGNTPDGFVMVDLTRTSPEILARYMGREQAQSFIACHRTPHPRVA
jgi:hypothetical protein